MEVAPQWLRNSRNKRHAERNEYERDQKETEWKGLINDEQKTEQKKTRIDGEKRTKHDAYRPLRWPIVACAPLSTMSFIQPYKQNEKKNNHNTS